jgi:hypothetical protein
MVASLPDDAEAPRPPAVGRKIHVICDAFSRTGGPEALHQLGRALADLGHDVSMVYVPRDLVPAVSEAWIEFPALEQPMPAAYAHYDLPHATRIEDRDGVSVVLPELWPSLIPYFERATPYLWWLSVDNARNAVAAIGGIGALSGSRAVHLCQSYYAIQYLAEQGIHGLPLFDYTSPELMSFVADPMSPRGDRVLYSTKGRWFTDKLRRWSPRLNWREISGFTQDQVAELFRTSPLYIDFGNHPGKDRMPREAAMLGCCVITGRRGAAANAFDVPIPGQYKFTDSRWQIPRIARTIRDVLRHYDARTQDFERYRRVIRGEYREFLAQALRVFGGRLELPPGDA